MSRRRPRVAVLYNAPTLAPEHPDHASEASVVGTARAVLRALRGRGVRAFPLSARPPAQRLVRSLVRKAPDVVFNLIEGFGGRSGGEAWVTSLLDLMNIPYTGCPPEAQGLCRHKGRTKALLAGSGLPTARFVTLGPGDGTSPSFPGPWFVKPEAEDASLGIGQGSVVFDLPALDERVKWVRERYGPCVLVEEYLPGGEYNVGVVGLPEPEALPVAEVVFNPTEGAHPILTYEAKWAVGSTEDLASPVRCPAEIAPDLAETLGRLAVGAFRATGCRDVARVDLRIDAHGSPMVLEVNPNPDLDPSAGWARALKAAGRDYGETLEILVRQALDRGKSS